MKAQCYNIIHLQTCDGKQTRCIKMHPSDILNKKESLYKEPGITFLNEAGS
jgi:hypothetical protein